jgi:hypothetical protein
LAAPLRTNVSRAAQAIPPACSVRPDDFVDMLEFGVPVDLSVSCSFGKTEQSARSWSHEDGSTRIRPATPNAPGRMAADAADVAGPTRRAGRMRRAGRAGRNQARRDRYRL